MATFVNVFVSYQISDHCLTLWSGFLEMTEVVFLWRLSLLHKLSVWALLKSSPGLCLHAGKILLFHFWAVVCFCCAGFYCLVEKQSTAHTVSKKLNWNNHTSSLFQLCFLNHMAAGHLPCLPPSAHPLWALSLCCLWCFMLICCFLEELKVKIHTELYSPRFISGTINKPTGMEACFRH